MKWGSETSIGRFYAMVGALLWSPALDKYLILKRAADKDFAGGSWECVTGRVDQGEGFSDAVRREVYEELGVEVEIDFIIGTTHFYRGDERPENEMVGVQYFCSIEDPKAIRVSAEHSEHRWVGVEKARGLFVDGHWLIHIIERAEAMKALLPVELVNFYRVHGFEV